MGNPYIYRNRSRCKTCGSKLYDVEYKLTLSGKCPCCKDTLGKYKKSKLQVNEVKIAEYLAIVPITLEELMDMPTGTPVWIQTNTGTEAVITFADVITAFVNGNIEFLSELSLPVSDYNVTWRLWPTFKTFRPTDIDADGYKWLKPSKRRRAV